MESEESSGSSVKNLAIGALMAFVTLIIVVKSTFREQILLAGKIIIVVGVGVSAFALGFRILPWFYSGWLRYRTSGATFFFDRVVIGFMSATAGVMCTTWILFSASRDGADRQETLAADHASPSLVASQSTTSAPAVESRQGPSPNSSHKPTLLSDFQEASTSSTPPPQTHQAQPSDSSHTAYDSDRSVTASEGTGLHGLNAQLDTENGDELRALAKLLYEAPVLSSNELDRVADRIDRGQSTTDRTTADALAWLCKVLGKGANGRYKSFMAEVAQNAAHKQLRKYAQRVADALPSGSAESYVGTRNDRVPDGVTYQGAPSDTNSLARVGAR